MQPILRDFPNHFETERLLVRAPSRGDGLAVYEATIESLAELRAWPASLPWACKEPTLEESEAFCRVGQSAFLARTDLPLLVFLKDEPNTLIGCTGLHRFNWAVPKFEIGYWGRTSYLGKGLMTEAIQGVTRFGFSHLGARRIESLPDEANIPSRRIVERCGYKLEGILHNERIDPSGALHNTCVYAITS